MNEFLTAFKDEIGVGPEGIVKARVWQVQTVDSGSNLELLCNVDENRSLQIYSLSFLRF